MTILLVLFTTAEAQDFKSMRLGLKASPSFAWLNTETASYKRDGVKLGFSYGLIVDVPFSKSADFSSGVFINHTGGKLNFSDIREESITSVSRNYSLSYLEVPATIKMRTSEFGYFTYYAQFGLDFGFQIGASAMESYGRPVRQVDDFNKETHFLSSALIMGIGTEYAFGGRTALKVGITYNNGFLGVLKGKDNLGRTRKATASSFELSLGVIF